MANRHVGAALVAAQGNHRGCPYNLQTFSSTMLLIFEAA